MRNDSILVAPLVLSLVLVGCKDEQEQPVEPAPPTQAEEAPTGEPAASGEGHGHEHAGDRIELGRNTAHGLEVTAVQIGEVNPGGEGTLEVKLSDSQQGAVIVRTWIGDEQATGVVKSKMEYNPLHDDYDAHAEAPDDLEGAQWWVEVEPPDAEKMSTPFPIGKKEARLTPQNDADQSTASAPRTSP